MALVTGAGSAGGIGFATARRLVEAGAAVAVVSTTDRIRERARELQAVGGTVVGIVADLTVPDDVARTVDTVSERLGGLHVLVNNAGMTQVGHHAVRKPVGAWTPEEWAEDWARNVTTAFLTLNRVAPMMKRAGYGRVINVSSVTGPLVAMPEEVPYATGKAALVGLTRAAALDLAPYGITVNAVAPGWIATASATAAELAAGRATPLGRPGTPDEVAAAIVWLASPDASYVTGQVIVVDGGNIIQEAKHADG